jgi:hypothetical protein
MMVVKVVVIRPKLTPKKKEIRGSLIYGSEGGSYSSKTDSPEIKEIRGSLIF